MTIIFTATVDLPGFEFYEQYRENPRLFIEHWLEGAASNCCSRFPVIRGGHTGVIINRPKAKVSGIKSVFPEASRNL